MVRLKTIYLERFSWYGALKCELFWATLCDTASAKIQNPARSTKPFRHKWSETKVQKFHGLQGRLKVTEMSSRTHTRRVLQNGTNIARMTSVALTVEAKIEKGRRSAILGTTLNVDGEGEPHAKIL